MAGYEDQFYASQVDTSANNFSSPQNLSMVMNRGWGMDPNLLTPSYTASYRPPWEGSGPSSDYSKPGFFKSIHNLSPLADFGYTAPQDNWSNSVSGVVNAPVGAAAFIAQRIAAPALAYGLAGKMLGPRSFMGAFKGEGIGAAFGKRAVGSFASGIGRGAGLSAVNAGRLGMAAGVAGSAIGAVAAPLVAGMAMMEGAERAFFNPFINNMKTAESLRENFKGVTFSGTEGNQVTGRGLSRKEAMKHAQGITRDGISDMMFSTSDYKDIADMSVRAGLLDHTKAPDITKKIKGISEQIKMIIAISKDPNIQNAVESLAKLQMSGASGNIASSAYSQIGMKASMAGASIQKVMDTVGAQGEYLFRQNGMTGYQGQLAAANSYSSFSAAARMGLISHDQMARLGGLDGATQASLTGQVNASRTVFNRMRMYNQNFGNGNNGNMSSNIVQFGQSMSKDSMTAMGAGMLYESQMAGNEVKNKGAKGIEEQLMQLVKQHPGIMVNGKISAERATPFLVSQMGMTLDQVHAFFNERLADTNGEVLDNRKAGRQSFVRDQLRTMIDQDGSYSGPLGKPWGATRRAGRAAVNLIKAGVVDPISSGISSAEDYVENMADEWTFGNTVEKRTPEQVNRDLEDIMGGATGVDPGSKKEDIYKVDTDSMFDGGQNSLFYGDAHKARVKKLKDTTKDVTGGDRLHYQGALESLNKLAAAGGEKAAPAIAALKEIHSGGENRDIVKAGLKKALMYGQNDETIEFFNSSDMIEDLTSKAMLSTSDEKIKESEKVVTESLDFNVDAATGLKGGRENLSVISDAQSLVRDGFTIHNQDDPKFKGRLDSLSKKLDKKGDALADEIVKISKRSNRLVAMATTNTMITRADQIADKQLREEYKAAKGDKRKEATVIAKVSAKINGFVYDQKTNLEGGITDRNALRIKQDSAISAIDDSYKSQTELNLKSYTESTKKLSDAAETMRIAASMMLEAQGGEKKVKEAVERYTPKTSNQNVGN